MTFILRVPQYRVQHNLIISLFQEKLEVINDRHLEI